MNRILIIISILMLGSCAKLPTEKHQGKRDNIINVKDKIKVLEFNNVLLNNLCAIYIFDKYLLIQDYKSYDYLVHLFDKNSFKYITSRVPLGQGPGEITNIGNIIYDQSSRRLLINDHGKQKVFSYELDSLLNSDSYMPKVEAAMSEKEFPSWYYKINDTLYIGGIIKPTGNFGFNKLSAKWNIKTGEINYFEDLHPEIEQKRFSMAVSEKYNMIVECYSRQNLMVIRSLNGELKYNIYGEETLNNPSIRTDYFFQPEFCRDKIIVKFSGEDAFHINKDGSTTSNWTTKLLIFNLDGDYLKTLELEYKVHYFCYDEENNRLILSMNDEIQFGYLDLNGLID